MNDTGWKQVVADWPWFHGEGSCPVQPNSEFMPPVRVLRKPYGCWDPIPLSDADPSGWPITEYEEALSLRPGLRHVAHYVFSRLIPLAHGKADPDFSDYKLRHNDAWPSELAEHPAALEQERFVLLLPLALSLSMDDKARVRWTLYGGSEQGPGRAFWKSFWFDAQNEWPARQGLEFFRRLLRCAYGERAGVENLHAAGFRILPLGDDLAFPWWREELPSWTRDFIWAERQPLGDVRYLLTFRPFRHLPRAVRRAYLEGKLHLLPFPGSLMFWGAKPYFKLQKQLPLALQVPLLHVVERHRGIHGMRLPQSGWLEAWNSKKHSRAQDRLHHGPILNTFRRTYRHDRIRRTEDDLVAAREAKLAHILFSTAPNDVGLYDKPMARNFQIWTEDFDLLLDGPRATPADIRLAAQRIAEGGLFGYRFLSPPMQAGRHQILWHRPLIAYHSQECVTLVDGPAGYLTAYDARDPELDRAVELWPRFLHREGHAANVEQFLESPEGSPHESLFNIRGVLESWEMLGKKPVSRSFARHLLSCPKTQTLAAWLKTLPDHAKDRQRGVEIAQELEEIIEPAPRSTAPRKKLPSLTYARTATRQFEVTYWEYIARLSAGEFTNKNNADCILDEATQKALKHHRRDLDPMGDYLLAYHAEQIARARMNQKALVGELPFTWRTDFTFPWMGGWQANQDGALYERNLIVVIPGKDRSRAVILADHYDTAYMADHYERSEGGTGARLAAAGADDNCSASAALMMATPVFLEMSKAGKLGCDVWLVHLTGEEYPAEGLGTCRLCQQLVEGTLRLRRLDGRWHDLSDVRIQGLYVMDMIAHNSNRGRDIFQISPGISRESLWLAYQAHLANEIWNSSVPGWNKKRKGAGRGKRSRNGRDVPGVSLHPELHGEVRLPFDPRSTLYNTDGQMYSDLGVPVVLFMENYDIDRKGYHDSADTMANINLDYGAGVAAIAIEATARAATATME